MSKVLILAAMVAVSLACHSRAEDEVGAAPDQADTTGAVTHVIDSTRTGPPGVGGRPGDATITLDSVGIDSALIDQENAETPDAADPSWTDTSLTSTPQDTLDPRDTGMEDTTFQDTTMVHGDSALTGHEVPDTTWQAQ